MMRQTCVGLLVVGLFALAEASGSPSRKMPVRNAEEDEIKNLPGIEDDAVEFRQYSGYLNSSEIGDFMPPPSFAHYWFVESQSDTPESDPIFIWLNGGPGTSSLYGLFAENGPFEVAADGKTLKLRNSSWNKLANLLYLESPSGVGFSYGLGQPGSTTDSGSTYELSVALDSFFKKFPFFSGSPLFLVGQGYGGSYVTELAYTALKNKGLPAMKGIIMGNAFLHADLTAKASIFFAHDNGLLIESVWMQVSQFCCAGKEPSRQACVMRGDKATVKCKKLLREIYSTISAAGVNPYNIQERCHKKTRLGSMLRRTPTASISSCDGGASELIGKYLNQEEVRSAIGIPRELGPWKAHTKLDYYNMNSYFEAGLKQELKFVLKSQVPVLMYNGDLDMVNSALGNEWFIETLGIKFVSERKPWKVNNQIAGNKTEYEGLTFATIKNAGHDVPRDKPEEILELIKSFLSDTIDYPN